MANTKRIPIPLALLAATALALAVLVSCAPASTGGGAEGIEVGNSAPPFAMTLEDGTDVTLKSIVDGDRPAHLFWFATW